MLRRPTADDRGSTALMMALTTTVIIGVGAAAVDVGNAVARRERAQTAVDQAAFAGSSQILTAIPESGAPTWPEDAPMLTAVAEALSTNAPLDSGGDHCVDEDVTDDIGCVSPLELLDGDTTNGEVSYVDGALRVVGPQARVQFAVGQVFSGSRWTDVQGTSAVGVYSLDSPMMPAFAVAGCDFGRQTLTDPANGQVSSTTPDLAFSADASGTTLSAVSPTTRATATPPVSPTTVSVTGKTFVNVTKLGFFRGDRSAPIEATVFPNPADAKTGNAGFDSPTSGSGKSASYTLEATLPEQVATTEALWYVRTFSKDAGAATGVWSAVGSAQALRIGNPVLECSAGSSDGNFGTLRLDRTVTPPADDLALNLALSIQPPLTLTVHPAATSDGLCTDGVGGAVETSGDVLRRGTNCVATDPGLSAQAATRGLITGVTSGDTTVPGRLAGLQHALLRRGCRSAGRADVHPRQRRGHHPQQRHAQLLPHRGLAGRHHHSDYSGGTRLDASILDSPRLSYVPVLAVDPAKGASARYSVIDFRPAFITDEVVSSSTVAPGTQSADNGLTISGGRLTTMRVIFFHADALPRPDDADVTDYLGIGTPIVRLVD